MNIPGLVVGSVAELVKGQATRTPMKAADSLSGSTFEWVEVDGQRCLLKYLCVDDDWIMRATGDLEVRHVDLWRRGLFERLPSCIDHAVLGVAAWHREDGRACAALLMRDVGASLVPAGSAVIAQATHHQFLDHMAQLHAALSGEDLADVFPLVNHYLFLGPEMAAIEVARGTDGVPVAVQAGWSLFGTAAPRVAGLVRALLEDPSPLVSALDMTPQTTVHGDWKLGNLGAADGHTLLLDWDRCGRGPATLDLAWYLAVNCDRIPESKESAIAFYRSRLEAHGVETAGWFEQQLGLALIGGLLQLGWAKAGGAAAEIAWWEERALDAAPLLS